MTLVMDFFETERHYDVLTVYDGNDVVAKYSGEGRCRAPAPRSTFMW